MGRAHCRLNILGHEAAHRLLFSQQAGQRHWSAAGSSPTRASRPSTSTAARTWPTTRTRWAPTSPTAPSTAGYPIPVDSFRRKLKRDAPVHLRVEEPQAARAGADQAGSRAAGAAHPRHAAGDPRRCSRPSAGRGSIPLLWLAPWMTVWKVLNRLRAIAEHGGMTRSTDRRLTTHVVRQTPVRPVLDGAVQHRLAPRPPRRHGHPVAQPAAAPRRAGRRRLGHRRELEYPSYRALWKALSSGGTSRRRTGPEPEARRRGRR